MKLVRFCYDSPENPWCGGGGAQRCWETSRLIAKDHTVTIYTGAVPGKTHKAEPNLNIRRIGWSGSYLVSRLSFSIFANIIVHLVKADIIVLENSVFAPVFCWRKNAVSVLYHLWGREVAEKVGLIACIFRAVEHILVRQTRYIITATRAWRYRLSDINPKARIGSIPLGHNEPTGFPYQAGKHILYFGRLDMYQKGIDVLIVAFANLIKKHPNAELIIAGRGEDESYRSIWEMAHSCGLAGENLCVMRGIADDARKEYYDSAQFVVMPSRVEGYGIAALEAAAHGKMVIGADIDGLREVIVDGVTGVLIPSGSVAALENAMLGLFNNWAYLEQQSSACKKHAAKYTYGATAEDEMAFYKSVAREV